MPAFATLQIDQDAGNPRIARLSLGLGYTFPKGANEE